MEICLVSNYFPPWRGGIETYTYSLGRLLSTMGHTVKVLCANDPLSAGVYKVDGVSVRRLWTLRRFYGTPLIPALYWRLMLEDVDIIHVNFPNPYNAFVVSIASKVKGVPAVITWHNDLVPPNRLASLIVAAHDRLVLPLYMPTFAKIISTSKTYAESSPIMKKYIQRVVVIPNGVDCKRFSPSVDGGSIRARYGLAGYHVILFLGALSRWHGYKGLDTLLHAFAQLKKSHEQVKLLIVGEGALKYEYMRLSLQLGIRDDCIFAGDVPDMELPEYYAASDVVIVPSKDKSEGFGLVILEANACGKPVIGTNVGGIPSVIHNELNGLIVPPNDPQDLARAIYRLLRDEGLRVCMGREGRRLAEKYDWTIIAKATEEIYEEVLQSR